MPGIFVGPGGRVDPCDRTAQGEDGLPPHLTTHRRCALRELTEECGLSLTRPAVLCPLGRAITPTFSRIRFDTWFFMAVDPPLSGALVGNGELDALAWHPIVEAATLPIAEVTAFMVGLALRRAGLGPSEVPPAFGPLPDPLPPGALLYRWVAQRPRITVEAWTAEPDRTGVNRAP